MGMQVRAQYDLLLSDDNKLRLHKEQNERLIRMAQEQAAHVPEDVSRQEQRADYRMQLILKEIRERPIQGPNFTNSNNSALRDYQMQLMLLEQQKKKRRLQAQGIPSPDITLPPRSMLQNLQGQPDSQSLSTPASQQTLLANPHQQSNTAPASV